MNRSILIVICDFLLLSLLMFSTPDLDRTPGEGAGQQQPKLEVATNQVDSRQDLGAVMRLALNDERKQREALLGELAKTRDAAGKQQALLSEREKQVQAFQQELQSREQQSQRLQQDLQSKDQQALRLQQEQINALRQDAAAQTNILSLNQQLHASTVESLVSKEGLAALEAEARRQSDQAAALQKQLSQLQKSNQMILDEKQRLSGQLQVAEAEKRLTAEQSARMAQEVKIEREEKARLAEGVRLLAGKSGELARELHETRPQAANTIFNEFVTNRVQARFFASRTGLLGGDLNKDMETATVLVTDGTNTYALCHVQDTPLLLNAPGTEWEGLTGTLGHGLAIFPIRSLAFHLVDPRIVFMPVSQAQARELGCKVYRISPDPFKFQDAVLVGAREGYYGECKFQIDLSTPQYLRMDHNSLKGLFGKFNPSSGDLVFSKTGELLGVMANGAYCMMIHNFEVATTLRFGQDVRDQHTGEALSGLYSLVTGMPFKLR